MDLKGSQNSTKFLILAIGFCFLKTIGGNHKALYAAIGYEVV